MIAPFIFFIVLLLFMAALAFVIAHIVHLRRRTHEPIQLVNKKNGVEDYRWEGQFPPRRTPSRKPQKKGHTMEITPKIEMIEKITLNVNLTVKDDIQKFADLIKIIKPGIDINLTGNNLIPNLIAKSIMDGTWAVTASAVNPWQVMATPELIAYLESQILAV